MALRITVQHVHSVRDNQNARKLLREELDRTTGDIARRCLACALGNVPENAVIISWRKTLTGRALHKGSLLALESPMPKTRRALYIFLHECAHLSLHCKSSKPKHRREYEAEMFAHQKMAEAGIPVPEKTMDGARRYVAWKIHQAMRRGALAIDEDAYAFAGVALTRYQAQKELQKTP
ncbi:MAG: hypothetical protein WCL39_11520 [Armatimonadota bacterium]